jgi:hypothetical protein
MLADEKGHLIVWIAHQKVRLVKVEKTTKKGHQREMHTY